VIIPHEFIALLSSVTKVDRESWWTEILWQYGELGTVVTQLITKKMGLYQWNRRLIPQYGKMPQFWLGLCVTIAMAVQLNVNCS